MKTIAILCGRYLPGFKDGGPVRTIVNLVDCLGKEYRFLIITNDRDHGDIEPYKGIFYDKPNTVGDAEVYYLKPKGFKLSAIEKITKKADLVYVCGPYDDYAYKTLFLKRVGRISQPVVVASMGSFSEGAYGIKNLKKRIFIGLCKAIGLFKNIIWSVTSEHERRDVFRILGEETKSIVAEDLPRKVTELKIRNKMNPTKIIFLSRICEMKNLLYAIEILYKVHSDVIFDIYGTLEDEVYWNKCKKALEGLPDNVSWEYKGIADSERAIDIFSAYDIFLFPTLGENYGHVIFEALSAGCIPVISDQTCWKDLEDNGCGYIIALDQLNKYQDIINMLCSLPDNEFTNMRRSAWGYAKRKYEKSVKNTGYRKIFDELTEVKCEK